MRKEVPQLLDAALAFAPTRDLRGGQFRVDWDEPDEGPVSTAVKGLQSEYQNSLPDKRKEYLSASLPRFRFVAAEALKHFVPHGEVLDLGWALGYVSIIPHHLGFEPHRVDLNKLSIPAAIFAARCTIPVVGPDMYGALDLLRDSIARCSEIQCSLRLAVASSRSRRIAGGTHRQVKHL